MENKTHAKKEAVAAKAGKKAVAKKAEAEKKAEAVKKTESAPVHAEKKHAQAKTQTQKMETKTENKQETAGKKTVLATQKKERVAHIATPERKKRGKIQEKIARKLRPRFKGRFGKPNVRRKSIEKWQKWRKPRGIDIRKGTFKGRIPNSGYQSPREIRGLHPSGFEEVRIASQGEMKSLKSGIAIRIQAGVGQRKRKQMIAQAKQMGIHVLN